MEEHLPSMGCRNSSPPSLVIGRLSGCPRSPCYLIIMASQTVFQLSYCLHHPETSSAHVASRYKIYQRKCHQLVPNCRSQTGAVNGGNHVLIVFPMHPQIWGRGTTKANACVRGCCTWMNMYFMIENFLFPSQKTTLFFFSGLRVETRALCQQRAWYQWAIPPAPVI